MHFEYSYMDVIAEAFDEEVIAWKDSLLSRVTVPRVFYYFSSFSE